MRTPLRVQKPRQLCQDPSPAAWTRIVCASTHDTLSVLNYKNKKFRLAPPTACNCFPIYRPSAHVVVLAMLIGLTFLRQ
jgi:hypothetical protein